MQVKILGWLLLSTCRFTTMVSYLFGKLCAIAISGIRQLLDFPSLMCTVNANVFSKLFYCFSVWACTSKGTLPGFNKFKTLKPEFYLAKRNLGIQLLHSNSVNSCQCQFSFSSGMLPYCINPLMATQFS